MFISNNIPIDLVKNIPIIYEQLKEDGYSDDIINIIINSINEANAEVLGNKLVIDIKRLMKLFKISPSLVCFNESAKLKTKIGIIKFNSLFMNLILNDNKINNELIEHINEVKHSIVNSKYKHITNIINTYNQKYTTNIEILITKSKEMTKIMLTELLTSNIPTATIPSTMLTSSASTIPTATMLTDNVIKYVNNILHLSFTPISVYIRKILNNEDINYIIKTITNSNVNIYNTNYKAVSIDTNKDTNIGTNNNVNIYNSKTYHDFCEAYNISTNLFTQLIQTLKNNTFQGEIKSISQFSNYEEVNKMITNFCNYHYTDNRKHIDINIFTILLIAIYNINNINVNIVKSTITTDTSSELYKDTLFVLTSCIDYDDDYFMDSYNDIQYEYILNDINMKLSMKDNKLYLTRNINEFKKIFNTYINYRYKSLEIINSATIANSKTSTIANGNKNTIVNSNDNKDACIEDDNLLTKSVIMSTSDTHVMSTSDTHVMSTSDTYIIPTSDTHVNVINTNEQNISSIQDLFIELNSYKANFIKSITNTINKNYIRFKDVYDTKHRNIKLDIKNYNIKLIKKLVNTINHEYSSLTYKQIKYIINTNKSPFVENYNIFNVDKNVNKDVNKEYTKLNTDTADIMNTNSNKFTINVNKDANKIIANDNVDKDVDVSVNKYDKSNKINKFIEQNIINSKYTINANSLVENNVDKTITNFNEDSLTKIIDKVNKSVNILIRNRDNFKNAYKDKDRFITNGDKDLINLEILYLNSFNITKIILDYIIFLALENNYYDLLYEMLILYTELYVQNNKENGLCSLLSIRYVRSILEYNKAVNLIDMSTNSMSKDTSTNSLLFGKLKEYGNIDKFYENNIKIHDLYQLYKEYFELVDNIRNTSINDNRKKDVIAVDNIGGVNCDVDSIFEFVDVKLWFKILQDKYGKGIPSIINTTIFNENTYLWTTINENKPTTKNVVYSFINNNVNSIVCSKYNRKGYDRACNYCFLMIDSIISSFIPTQSLTEKIIYGFNYNYYKLTKKMITSVFKYPKIDNIDYRYSIEEGISVLSLIYELTNITKSIYEYCDSLHIDIQTIYEYLIIYYLIGRYNDDVNNVSSSVNINTDSSIDSNYTNSFNDSINIDDFNDSNKAASSIDSNYTDTINTDINIDSNYTDSINERIYCYEFDVYQYLSIFNRLQFVDNIEDTLNKYVKYDEQKYKHIVDIYRIFINEKYDIITNVYADLDEFKKDSFVSMFDEYIEYKNNKFIIKDKLYKVIIDTKLTASYTYDTNNEIFIEVVDSNKVDDIDSKIANKNVNSSVSNNNLSSNITNITNSIGVSDNVNKNIGNIEIKNYDSIIIGLSLFVMGAIFNMKMYKFINKDRKLIVPNCVGTYADYNYQLDNKEDVYKFYSFNHSMTIAYKYDNEANKIIGTIIDPNLYVLNTIDTLILPFYIPYDDINYTSKQIIESIVYMSGGEDKYKNISTASLLSISSPATLLLIIIFKILLLIFIIVLIIVIAITTILVFPRITKYIKYINVC